jgi:hypothetical protein
MRIKSSTGCATLCALRIVPLTFCVRVVAVSMTPQQMLEFELEVLRKVDGCSGVNDFGTEGGPGQYGVHLHVRPAPGAPRKFKRVACASDKPTKLDAARVARAHVVEVLGAAAVERAEQIVREQRAAARAASSSSVPRNVNAVLGETQRLAAVLRAAESRAEKAETAAEHAAAEAAEAAAAILREPEAVRKQAWQEVEAACAAADAHAKRQRVEPTVEAVKEPAWRSRPYAAYDTVDKWVRREGELWNRRRVQLSADKPGRSAEHLRPHGPNGNDGPLNHWRRSVVGAVLDWADGSVADAAKVIFWVIEELGLQVRFAVLPDGSTSLLS